MPPRDSDGCTEIGVPAEQAARTTAPRALVVDDDAAIRILVTRILTRRGFLVDAVRDGAEAIEHLLQHDYALIALDLMMPRIDGYGVLKYLAQHQPDTLARVTVMSAFGAKAQERVPPRVGRFLEKPFDVDQLLAETATAAGITN